MDALSCLTPRIKISDLDGCVQHVEQLCKFINYKNAGTIEFLVDSDGTHYFIEVKALPNPSNCRVLWATQRA